MAYVKKIIRKEEHIIGIARLHWIYLAKGMFGFIFCLIMGLAIDAVLVKSLTSLSELAPNTGGKMLVVVGSWVTPLFVIFGGFYFLLYLLKVLYTEIALTEKRIIHKSGFIFVKIEEIDIEEISAENMDMGYFGTFLGYGYIMLDCRFVGDVKLPAIARANTFVKALHAARTKVTPMYPDATQVAQALVQELPSHTSKDEKPEHEMLKPQEPKPFEPQRDENGDVVHKEEASAPETAANHDPDHEKEILQLQIAKLELEVKLKEVEAAEADTKAETTENDIQKPMYAATTVAAPAPRAIAPQTVAQPTIAPVNVVAAVQGGAPDITKMPQVTDKIAEELIASGLIPHPDEIKPTEPFVEEPAHPKASTDEERLEPTKADPLQHSFGSAAFVFEATEDGNPKPQPAI
jgi:hypothetical protein